ncbi:Transcription factor [Cordyceps fumosorosea ARSEF 2679]|uniref:Transcription factor n=1 Tax=Cordyceps fumosorosea (strain ARSEF 2679) TaxID=1081104 RepID=A0A167LF30_CORFA|nr:Transcription factor [Cordyceps fumosorosea ARSEF 2679]OAA53012.1 Transcription factor [Cordyceps fumosorosea ARSEF 2679]
MQSGAEFAEPSPSAADHVGLDPDSDFQSDVDDDAVRGSKRKRPLSVSCELCKQRKVKCDRGQPSCGWCSRNGATCEYKERKKPGLRAGYGKELEQRLDNLESILISHSKILQSIGYTVPDGSPVRVQNIINQTLPGEQGTLGDSSHPSRPHDQLNTPQKDVGLFVEKHSSFTASPQNPDFAVTPAPVMHDGFQRPPSTISATSHPSSAVPEYYQHPPANLPHHAGTQGADQDLPPYDLVYSLVDLYFKNVNTWCPILHRKTTLDSLFGPSALEEADLILLHAIVATTMRYSTDVRLTEERRANYHKISKAKVILYGMENSSVKSLQALVILALDLCGSSNGPPGWNIMALITRSVVQLGLAVETTSSMVSPGFTSIYTLRAMVLPEPKDFIEDESRRRLFWMIYLLDRYATIATAFEFALDDKEIDRSLPCRDDLWVANRKVETKWFRTFNFPETASRNDMSGTENLGAFSYYIEVLGILSKIHKFLKQPVDIGVAGDVERWQLRYKELDSMLTSWKLDLPGEFNDMNKIFQPGSRSLSCTWLMLHATYHTTVIRLHSSAAYPTTRSPIFTPSYSASQRCLIAVENIASLADFASTNGYLSKLGPPFAFSLWVSARLLLVHGSTVEHKLSPQIAFFVDTLRALGGFWPVAQRYCNLLQRVLDEHRDSEQKGDGITPSSVRILADMRRTAFDLDFLISRQPRHGTHTMSRLPSVTPARTPAVNDLEYLDVFDFFNVPRLPVSGDALGVPSETMPQIELQAANSVNPQAGIPTDFNITNFMMDVNSDWFKQEGGKFLAQG